MMKMMIIIIMMIFLRALTLLVGRQEGHLASKKLGAGLMDGDDLTTALQVLQLQLSQPLPPALAPIKLANPGLPGKMTIKREKDRARDREGDDDDDDDQMMM